MVLWVALCVGAAGVVDEAGVDAGAAHAHLRVQALLVPLATDRFTCRTIQITLLSPSHQYSYHCIK